MRSNSRIEEAGAWCAIILVQGLLLYTGVSDSQRNRCILIHHSGKAIRPYCVERELTDKVAHFSLRETLFTTDDRCSFSSEKLREVVVHRLTPTVTLPGPGQDPFCDQLQISSSGVHFPVAASQVALLPRAEIPRPFDVATGRKCMWRHHR